MKTLLKIVAATLVCLVLVLLALRVTGLDPKDRRPGLWLRGDVVTTPVADWSFADKYPTLLIQTRTWYLLPHSVTIRFVCYKGQLYLHTVSPKGAPFPKDKSWTTNLIRDPHVRIKIGNQLFDRTATLATDPAEMAGLMDARAKKTPGVKHPSDSITYWFHVLPE
ncbi:MAG: nitroreductase/quinone reductase family protein [Acidobacteriia bacterium]|nr:nitroreductase/quinone reductase family protein [Terriglobia bacterium]